MDIKDALRAEVDAARFHSRAALKIADGILLRDPNPTTKHLAPQLAACDVLLETAVRDLINVGPFAPFVPMSPNPMKDWEAIELERLLNLYIDVYVDKDDAGLMKHTPTATEILDDLKLSLEQ